MSLEAAIKELTEAVTAQTTFLKSMKAGTAPAGKAAEAPKDKPAADKKKKITLDTIKERFGAYLGVEDKTERAKRKANVMALTEHFSVARATEIDEDKWPEALKYLDQFEAGKKADFMSDDGDDSGDDDDSMI